jgi:hypothetical protein
MKAMGRLALLGGGIYLATKAIDLLRAREARRQSYRSRSEVINERLERAADAGGA